MAATLSHRRLPLHDLLLRGGDTRDDWRKEKEVDERGVELRAAPFEERTSGDLGRLAVAVTPAVRDRVVRVGDGDDARGERNAASLQAARISGAVPALVVREHAFGEVGVEALQRLEHVRAALRVRGDRSAIGGGERRVVVDDVEQRFVDLADVVKESDAMA